MGFGSKSSTKSHTEIYLTFHLKVRAPHLWVAPYDEYQHLLFETITDFREKGWNFQQIADWLNENDYTTAWGKRCAKCDWGKPVRTGPFVCRPSPRDTCGDYRRSMMARLTTEGLVAEGVGRAPEASDNFEALAVTKGNYDFPNDRLTG